GIIGLLPSGTGVSLLAAHEVELFDNEIRGNQTSSIGIISYLATGTDYDDPEYNPYADTIYIHGNTFADNGTNYDTTSPLSFLVVDALTAILTPPFTIPDIVFFGFVDPSKADPGDPRRFQAAYNLCIAGDQGASFANLDMALGSEMVTTDMSAHDCTHPPLPAITLGQ
ncbi:MAG: hypothetical protein AAGC55_17660, partial [Myxococcota bacterium]